VSGCLGSGCLVYMGMSVSFVCVLTARIQHRRCCMRARARERPVCCVHARASVLYARAHVLLCVIVCVLYACCVRERESGLDAHAHVLLCVIAFCSCVVCVRARERAWTREKESLRSLARVLCLENQ